VDVACSRHAAERKQRASPVGKGATRVCDGASLKSDSAENRSAPENGYSTGRDCACRRWPWPNRRTASRHRSSLCGTSALAASNVLEASCTQLAIASTSAGSVGDIILRGTPRPALGILLQGRTPVTAPTNFGRIGSRRRDASERLVGQGICEGCRRCKSGAQHGRGVPTRTRR
jgi:hypothetical protein